MHVRLRCLPLLQATLSLLLVSGATVAQAGPIPGPTAITCQNPAVTAQLSVLSGQISEKVQDIANCNPPSGVPACTRAQISAIQATLSKLQSEYEAEFAQCEPAPPPPTQASVGVAGVEVTQVIQDMNESVPLIAGKQTWVRVYLSASGTPSLLTVTGTIQVQSSNGAVVTLRPPRRLGSPPSRPYCRCARILARASLQTAREPDDRRHGGHHYCRDHCRSGRHQFGLPKLPIRDAVRHLRRRASVTIADRADPIHGHERQRHHAARDRLRAVGIVARPRLSHQPSHCIDRYYPTDAGSAVDALHQHRGRLQRGQHLSQHAPHHRGVQLSPVHFSAGRSPHALLRNGAYNSTNSMLANGGFMRGCSPIGGYVSSGPTGPSSLFPGGDSTQTFGDWYGGHEIGHSFGRAHPGFINSAGVAVGYCGAAGPDTLYPYPNAQISDNQDDLVGLDVGDTTNGIPLAVLDGVSHFDVMSYCALPQWMSDYTYEAILSGPSGLVAEDPSGNGPARSVLVEGRYVSIIASLNLTKKTGKFEFVQTVGAALRVSAPSTTKALLEYVDAAGRPLGRYEVNANFVADADPGEDVTALINSQIPFVAGAAKLNLYLGDKLLDSRSIPITPPAIRDLRVAAEGTVTWDATRAPGAVLTYFVQASQDGKNWDVIAINLSEREFALSPAQRRAYASVRVFANDGFNSSEPVEVGLRQR